MNIESVANTIIEGDCIDVLKQFPPCSVDLVLTDPPYLSGYTDRYGRTLQNDRDSGWLKPAFSQIYRVLKPDSFCISFYGWHQVDKFMSAWRQAGFYPVGHIVWKKYYSSSRRYLSRRHEQAYLLAKGRPAQPAKLLPDVLDWKYTGNPLHPTQKPVMAIAPLIDVFSKPNDIILDPLCGSRTTAMAAKQAGRRFICIEKDPKYFRIAKNRLSA